MSAQGSVHRRHTRNCPQISKGVYADHRCRGPWYWTLDVNTDVVGERRRITKSGFMTQKEAQEALNAARQHFRNLGSQHARGTTGEYLEDWLEAMKGIRKPSTYASYEQHVRNHLLPEVGHIRLLELTRQDLQRVVTKLLSKTGRDDKPLSGGTIRNIMATMRAALEVARKDQAIPSNPAEFVKLPQIVRRPSDAWCIDEVAQFLDHMDGRRRYTLWHLALHTGLRRGQLVGLLWHNIDFVQGTITVQFNDTQVAGKIHRGGSNKQSQSTGKTQIITIDQGTLQVLRDWYVLRLMEHRAWQKIQGADPAAITELPLAQHVFCNPKDKPLTPDLVTRNWGQDVKRAGVRAVWLHEARHTHATLAMPVADLKTVSNRLGHSSVKITGDTYQHANLEDDRRAAEAVAAGIAARRGSQPDPEPAMNGASPDHQLFTVAPAVRAMPPDAA